METELKNLRIDRAPTREPAPARWAVRWIIGGVLLFLLLGVGRFAYNQWTASAPEVEVIRVHAAATGATASSSVILNATGYIVSHHKIEVAAKVIGKVLWIGVEKGDKVKQTESSCAWKMTNIAPSSIR